MPNDDLDHVPHQAGWEAHCLARHTGLWLYEPARFAQAFEAFRADRLPMRPVAAHMSDEPPESSVMAVAGDVAIIRLSGSLMKAESKFGGTSTVSARAALRRAARSNSIKGILLHIDESPGGHVSGTDELGADIRAAAAMKPMRAHADDLVASAAYWAASQAPVLSMNRMGEAGSIGVYALVQDTSEMFKEAGVRSILVSSGEAKGDFAPGLPVSDEAIGRLQQMVDRTHEAFVATVSKGRKMPRKDVAALATGETFGAKDALENGLIDEIASFDDALAALRADIRRTSSANTRRRAANSAVARLDIERAK